MLVTPIIPLVDNIGNAIEISIACFLAIWGFRQILVPNTEITQSLIDLILLGEYSLVILSLILTTISLSRRTNKSQMKADVSQTHFYSLVNSKVYHSPTCSIITKHQQSNMIQYENEEHAKEEGKQA